MPVNSLAEVVTDFAGKVSVVLFGVEVSLHAVPFQAVKVIGLGATACVEGVSDPAFTYLQQFFIAPDSAAVLRRTGAASCSGVSMTVFFLAMVMGIAATEINGYHMVCFW